MGYVLLVLALHGVIPTTMLGDNVDAHVGPLEAQLGQQLLGHVLQEPHVLQLADMFQVLDAELLKDITADLLVVACSHLGEGVCRFIVPFLALS